MSKVFISYRRDDSAGYAHAIHSRLVQHFSKDQVFMDVDTMEPGVDFVRAIEKAVGECDVLVALIGKRWAGGEPGGTSRFDNTKDYVRLEVSTALARDIRVIPVLVDGMTMPNEDSLPSPVQPITRRNAIEISNTRFNYDVDQLINAVRNILAATEAKRKADEEAERNRIKQEAEQRSLEAGAQRKAEEERVRDEERKRSEEESKRKAEEERRRKEEERNRAEQEAEQRRLEAEAQPKAGEERLREQERQRAGEKAKREADDENRRRVQEERNRAEQRRIEAETRRREEGKQKTDEPGRTRIGQELPSPWRTYGPVAGAVAVVLVIFSFVFWWPKEAIKETPLVKPQPPPKETVAAAPESKPEAQKEVLEQPPPEVKIQPEKQITATPQKKVEQKQEKPIITQSVLSVRHRLKDGGEGPEMVHVPAGSFRMGDLQDKTNVPVHTVNIQKPFAIGRYEVTFEEYDQFARAKNWRLPDDKGWGRGRRPVINVSWLGAFAYVVWLSEQTGMHYGLPSEAQWEYVARGGKETAYWWGKDLVKGMANCLGCGSQWDKKQTAPVGSFKPNPFGLYDTAGNVGEWVDDCWHENYIGAPTDGRAWKDIFQKDIFQDCDKVFRGGSWDTPAEYLRASYRNRANRGDDFNYVGFRVAWDPANKAPIGGDKNWRAQYSPEQKYNFTNELRTRLRPEGERVSFRR